MSGHGGNLTEIARQHGCVPADILDFSANINPLGPPEFLSSLINSNIAALAHYPDPDCLELVKALSHAYGQEPETILVGNGTSELLFQLPRVLQPKRAVIPVPSYIDYARSCSQAGIPVVQVPLKATDSFVLNIADLESILLPGDLLILGQPNNPTGQMVERDQLLQCIFRHPDVLFVIDEAFAHFVPGYTSLSGAAQNVIVLCSLTKIFAIPGLRLGFLVAAPAICGKIRHNSAPWSVNTLAQIVGKACVADSIYLEKSREIVDEQRLELIRNIGEIPALYPYPAAANFVLVRSEHPQYTGTVLASMLLDQQLIAIRTCANYQNLDEKYFRIAVRNISENNLLLQALRDIFQPSLPMQPAIQKTQEKKKPALMLLGTGSDVGKSVLVAALGRILIQDGVRVAPFKAQNMSLNSYVTRDGGEMGRAQVVQAQACRLDPDVRMNPVLLKPSSDVGSQIIVNGQPVGNMKVLEYMAYKAEIWKQVCSSYDSLSSEHDVILLEGAGSPGEVNLKSHDIVNSRMAAYAEAKVFLVGDIDRGGVYASFIGHFEVMEQWERNLLAGFLVNRFRGDSSLLGDAHEYMYQHTQKPVVGVIPYLHQLGLPQEDSVSFKAGLFAGKKPKQSFVEVAVIDLPHISNFTDIEPFFEEPDVFLRIVSRQEQLGTPDAIILPGSKNVPTDIAFLKKSGLGEATVLAAGKGVEIVGICGGYQMLGQQVRDPHGLEGGAGERCDGLGLLAMETELASGKTLTRKNGWHELSGCQVYGYEIHHGITTGEDQPVLTFEDGSFCGQSSAEGKTWGSYLHGIFDADGFRRWWINRLRTSKGLQPLQGTGALYDLEPAFNRLAAVVRDNIDMNLVYRLLGL